MYNIFYIFLFFFFYLCIIIRQEYRQEHRNRKDASHADNQELAEVFTPIHSLYPIPGICQENEAWQVFHCQWHGWLLFCLGFLRLHKLHHCCISFLRQLDIIVSAFLLQLAVTVLYILVSSVKTKTSLSTYFSSS